MSNLMTWEYPPPSKVFVFKVKGRYLPGFVAMVAANEHLARSLLHIYVGQQNNHLEITETWQPELVAELPIDQTCAVTIWNGDY